MPGSVYFIRCTSTGLIKIGYTGGSPVERLRRLRSTCPSCLESIGLMRGTIKDEAALHARFIEHWSHGEWFRPAEALTTYIAEKASAWDCPPGGTFKPVDVRPKPQTNVEWAETTVIVFEGETVTVAELMARHKLKMASVRAMLRYGHDFDVIIGQARGREEGKRLYKATHPAWKQIYR